MHDSDTEFYEGRLLCIWTDIWEWCALTGCEKDTSLSLYVKFKDYHCHLSLSGLRLLLLQWGVSLVMHLELFLGRPCLPAWSWWTSPSRITSFKKRQAIDDLFRKNELAASNWWGSSPKCVVCPVVPAVLVVNGEAPSFGLSGWRNHELMKLNPSIVHLKRRNQPY